MASNELIDEVISPKASQQVVQLTSDLEKLSAQFEATFKNAKALTDALEGAKNIPDTSRGTDDTRKSLNELEKIKVKLLQTEEKLAVASSEANKSLIEQKDALQQVNREIKEKLKFEQAEEGSINQMRSNLKQLQSQYDALGKSTRDAFGAPLLKQIQAVDTELKKLEGGSGRFQRNVGNYSNATFQLSQSLRELPAFAFSAQTGILALSNNLPMLIDEFNRTSKGVKQVKNELGEMVNDPKGGLNGASGAMKIFGQSIFSFTNLFTIALGLFTVFYKEIAQFVIGTKELNKEFVELNKSIATNGAELKILTNIINNHNISKDKQLKAAQRLKEIYPVTLKNYSDEAIVAGKASKEIDKLGQSIVALARIKAIEAKVTEYSASMLNNEISIRKASNDLLKLEIEAEMHLKRRDASGTSSNRYDIENQLYIEATAAIGRKQKYIKEAEEANKGFAQGIEDLATMAANELPKIVTEHEQMAKKELDIAKKSRKDKVKEYEGYISDINHLDREYQLYSEKSDQEAIDRVHKRQEEILKLNKEYQKMELDLIKNGIEAQEAMIDKETEAQLAQIQRIADIAMAVEDQLNSYSSLAFEIAMTRLDAREIKMNEYYDSEEERINKSFTNQADKEKHLAKLSAQREAEQKRIDKDRKKAQYDQAARQKAIGIAEIIVSTSLAVIKAFTEGDPYTKGARAAFAAVVGALNLARAIATPLPQFAKGTESSPEGYAIVGEKGTELVTDPSGKSWLTPAKDTITYLKKGSKVTTNEKLMEMVKNSAYVQLANLNTPVTSDMYSKTLVEQFETLTSKVDKLSNIMQDKAMSVQIQGNYDHYIHVRNNIR